MRGSLLAAGVTIALLGTGGVAWAGQDDLEDERFKGGDRTEFQGSCNIAGSVLYPDEPLKTQEQDLTVGVEADGTCEGTLDGESETFRVRVRGYKENERFGCGPVSMSEGPATLDDLPGELNPEPSAGDDEDNNIAVEITSNNPTGMRLEGRNGGNATGVFSIDDPAGVVERCQNEGNRKIDFEAELSTGPGTIAG